jgi:hypothetical protein
VEDTEDGVFVEIAEESEVDPKYYEPSLGPRPMGVD